SNLVIPNNNITAHVVGQSKINATSGLLVDFSPTVATIFTSNSTIFVLVPSLKAIVVGNGSIPSNHAIGASEKLNPSVKEKLSDLRPNISILSASISSSSNVTHISIVVKDNSNTSVMLRHLLVFGNYSVAITPISGMNTTVVKINSDGEINQIGPNKLNISDIRGGFPSNVLHSHNGLPLNITNRTDGIDSNLQSNSSTEKGQNGENETQSHEYEVLNEGLYVQHLRTFNFIIAPNGTLVIPSSSGEFDFGKDFGFGYNLSAESNVTLTFSGELSFGNGRIVILPVNGTEYRFVIGGEESASAALNVTAT
ncbi:MAG: hypothetical protein QXN59_02690, partial [Candidatus Micrarchaeaceae archaeon]